VKGVAPEKGGGLGVGARGAAPGREVARRLRTLGQNRSLPLVVVIVVAALVLSQVAPNFLTTDNLRAVLIGDVTAGLVVIGQTILLVSGGLDLSVGGVMALCGTVAAWLVTHGVPTSGGMAAGVALGVLFGSISGVVVAWLEVNPLIATLGMGSVTIGLALVMTEGYNISGLPPSMTALGDGRGAPLGLPWVVWIAVVLVLVGDLFLRRTRLFRQFYYLGGNERAAYLSGIRVRRLRVLAYALSGGLAACAGVLLAARLNAATPTAGADLPLTSIAAAVIGGASLAGGEGTVLGAVLGVFFLSLITNILTILGVSIYWQTVATGVVLIVVVAADMFFRGRASWLRTLIRKREVHRERP
jgi:ribose transport system permease protein